MADLPDRTINDTRDEHISDHNELHRLHNLFDDKTPSSFEPAGAVQTLGDSLASAARSQVETLNAYADAAAAAALNAAKAYADALVGSASVPVAPTIGTATPDTGQISIAFTPNGNGGSPITGFTATATSSDSGAGGSGSGTASPIIITGLTAGKHYTVTVHATNSIGNSAESSASSSVLIPSSGTLNKAKPFASDSPWNDVFDGSETWYDSPLLHNTFQGNYWWVGTTYAELHYVAPTDPLWSVVVPDFITPAWSKNGTARSFQVKAPADLTVPVGGQDYPLILCDPDTGDLLEFYQAAADQTHKIIYPKYDAANGDQGTASSGGSAPTVTTMTDSTKAWSINRWHPGTSRHVVVCTAAPNGGCWAPIESNTSQVLTLGKWYAMGSMATYSDGSGHAYPPGGTAYVISGLPGWGLNNAISGSGWTAPSASVFGGIHACGAALSGGLLTGYDWTAGVIDHALAFVSAQYQLYPSNNYSNTDNIVLPAVSGEPGGRAGSGGILMGTRIGIPSWTWLEAHLTGPQYTQCLADYNALSTTLINGKYVGKMIWDCLQTYGAYETDVTGGSTQFYADALTLPAGSWDGIYAHWNNYYGSDVSGRGAAMDVIKPYLRMLTPGHA